MISISRRYYEITIIVNIKSFIIIDNVIINNFIILLSIGEIKKEIIGLLPLRMQKERKKKKMEKKDDYDNLLSSMSQSQLLIGRKGLIVHRC